MYKLTRAITKDPLGVNPESKMALVKRLEVRYHSRYTLKYQNKFFKVSVRTTFTWERHTEYLRQGKAKVRLTTKYLEGGKIELVKTGMGKEDDGIARHSNQFSQGIIGRNQKL